VLAWLLLLRAALGTQRGPVWRQVHDAWLAELATKGCDRAYELRHVRVLQLHISNYGGCRLHEGETVLASSPDGVRALRVVAMFVVVGGAHALRQWARPLRASPHWRPMFPDKDERYALLTQELTLARRFRDRASLRDQVPGRPLRAHCARRWRLLWPRDIIEKVWSRHDCALERLAPEVSLPTVPPVGECGFWVENHAVVRLHCEADDRATAVALGTPHLLFNGIAWRFIT